jgi:hypothetical protein
MTDELKGKIQILLAFAIIIAGARTAYIFYERSQDSAKHAQAPAPPLNPDYYVVPKKLYPYDLKSARQLTQQPVWVKEGYRYTIYPFKNGRADFPHEAGLLLPIEKLQIKDVVAQASPAAKDERQVLAVFSEEGKDYAVPIGLEKNGEYKIYSDEMFYIQDPHDLYKHWPADVWQAIGEHQVKPGMNELQTDFAIGMGVPMPGSSEEKTVNYPNGGKPLSVTYHDGKAAEIKQGS